MYTNLKNVYFLYKGKNVMQKLKKNAISQADKIPNSSILHTFRMNCCPLVCAIKRYLEKRDPNSRPVIILSL